MSTACLGHAVMTFKQARIATTQGHFNGPLFGISVLELAAWRRSRHHVASRQSVDCGDVRELQRLLVAFWFQLDRQIEHISSNRPIIRHGMCQLCGIQNERADCGNMCEFECKCVLCRCWNSWRFIVSLHQSIRQMIRHAIKEQLVLKFDLYIAWTWCKDIGPLAYAYGHLKPCLRHATPSLICKSPDTRQTLS